MRDYIKPWVIRSQASARNQAASHVRLYSGTFAFEVHFLPTLPVEIERISALAFSDGRLFLAVEGGTYPLASCRPDGSDFHFFGPDSSILCPYGLSAQEDGTLLIADALGHAVYRLDSAGRILRIWGSPGHGSDTGVPPETVLDDMAYVRIHKRGEPFCGPTKAIFSGGRLYVSDGLGNCAIHIFRDNGDHVLSFGAPGQDPGCFYVPHSVAVDRYGRIWVADRDNDRVQVFTSTGEPSFVMPDLLYPCDIAMTKDYAFVAEADGRISVFNMEAQLAAQFGYLASGLRAKSITADAKGNLYLALMGFHHVVRLERLS